MPFKANKLVKNMDKFIENYWTEIKKTKQGFHNKPYYIIAGKNKEVATLTPIYQGQKKYILFEVSKGENTERIIINREHPDIFRYEKIVETDYGNATIKSFNSEYEINDRIERRIGDYIEQYFPKILSDSTKK